MRKIFFALMIACLMYTAPAAAQDVWITSGGDGTDWYIMDETISGSNGKFRWTNVMTKLVADDGSCIGVEWKFTQINPNDGRFANWVYSTVWDNAPNPEAEVLPGTNAEKILRYCLEHLNT